MPCYTASDVGLGTILGNLDIRMSSFAEMHPYLWSKDDVYSWLSWCKKEYAVSDVPLEKFSMNGKALCVLTKEDFKERAPNVGDVLYNTLHHFTSTNLHPSFRNSLSQLLPRMGAPHSAGNLMLSATAATALCNGFIPAAHLHQLLAQGTSGSPYPITPMTPESSPSAPSSSNPTPPRNATPTPPAVVDSRPPVIVVTEPASEAARGAASVSSSPASRSLYGSRSPHREISPNHRLQKLHKHEHQAEYADRNPHNKLRNDEDEPLNLSNKFSGSPSTPSPPQLTPQFKSEPPSIPGAGMQAALRAYNLPKGLSTTGSPSRHLLPSAASPSMLEMAQKFHQSGGTVIVNPDPRFATNHLGEVSHLVKDIKKEPGTEFRDLSPRPLQQQRQKSPVNNFLRQHSKPTTPVTPFPGSPDGDDSGLETPFSPPITPGGSLLGLTPGTPNGTELPSRPDGTGKLLWEFLSELLNDPAAQSDPKPVVRWIDMKTYTFQILDTGRLSSLWGQQKNRGTMNYEKLSRALRYYKKVGIIEKATGKRLTYKFMKPPSSIKRGQRGARPGVPRKNRRSSLQQTQQSETGDASSRPGTAEQTSAQFSLTPMPGFLPAVPLTAPALGQTSVNFPSASVAMFTGLPLVVPPTVQRLTDGQAALKNQSLAVRSSPTHTQAQPEEEELMIDEEETASEGNDDDVPVNENPEHEKIEKDETDSKDESQDSDDAKQKAVHLGMPSTVPIYFPKSRCKSQLSSLCKRRLMSASGEGNSPKKFLRLTLSKNNLGENNNNCLPVESHTAV